MNNAGYRVIQAFYYFLVNAIVSHNQQHDKQLTSYYSVTINSVTQNVDGAIENRTFFTRRRGRRGEGRGGYLGF